MRVQKQTTSGMPSQNAARIFMVADENVVVHEIKTILKIVRDIHQLINREKNVHRLMQGVCDCLVCSYGYSYAWIALLGDHQKLLALSEAGVKEPFVQNLKTVKNRNDARCIQNLQEKSHFLMLQNHDSVCRNCPIQKKCSTASKMMVRLEYGHKMIGWFGISAAGDFLSYPAEESLFEELAGDVATAIEDIHILKKHRQMEKSQIRERDLFCTLLDTLPDAISFQDGKGHYRQINPVMAHTLGLQSPREAMGKTDFDFLPESLAREQVRDRQKIIQTRIPIVDQKKSSIRPDGTRNWASVTKVPVLDKKGNIRGILGISRDITRMQETETRLQKTQWDLETVSSDLNRSNADLTQITFIASHDFQESLRTVASYVQLLQRRYKDRLDATADEFISFAIAGVTRLQDQIQDFLTYSWVDTKDKFFESSDCKQIAHKAIKNLYVLVSQSRAEIICKTLPILSVDRIQMAQLFQNLIENAIKFKGSKTPQITISAEEKEKEWLFSIQDNGVGIDSRYYSRIFMVFQKLHDRGKYSGTGIGLAISKKIVERHGGKIWVESEPEKGSTFYFTIPKGLANPAKGRTD